MILSIIKTMKYRISAIILLCVLVFFEVSCSYLPADEDLADTIIYNETTEYITLSSVNEGDSTGFMFLPGGLVDPHAYLTLMEKLAQDSIQVLIPKFSTNLAITELSKFKKLINEFPDINVWYIGGHSLGGIAALSAVKDDPDIFKGLILLGVYPSESFDISTWEGQVLSIYAENDQLSTVEEVEAAVSYLPQARFISEPIQLDTMDTAVPNTIYYCISGGNHAQFGDYGFQRGDGTAEITKDEQHEKIHDAIMTFMKWNSGE